MSHDETIETMAEMPIRADQFAWPIATLDPVSKMRALAAALPYCAIGETVLEAEYDRVWDLIIDFEHGTPRYEGLVNKVKILERSESRLLISSRMISGFWIKAEVFLQPGWCLMTSSQGQVGMAARPEGESRTRFIHFEGSTLFGRLLRPFFHWNIGGDFKRLNALLK